MLDINLFRVARGGNLELIRESQRRRFADVDLVDRVVEFDEDWRTRQFELDGLLRDFNAANNEVATLRMAGMDASEAIQRIADIKILIVEKSTEVKEAKDWLYSTLEKIGNIVHHTVPIGNNQDDNLVVRSWGERRTEPNLKTYVELVELLGPPEFKIGQNVGGGGGGFFLEGVGFRLSQALINFGMDFLGKRGYAAKRTPFHFRQEIIMPRCAQLAQFDDEELYELTGEGGDKYLIAADEQPLCGYHIDTWIHPSDLPKRYAGYSTCFHQEAGSHGRDALGFFRVHQFEKVEQFSITSPNASDSWDMHEEMIRNSEDFYKQLNLPYQVVSIVSGALNDAAAKKYDLNAWFPASKAYRDQLSCSNCTDYQSRKLEIRYGQKKNYELMKQYVHLLSSTLTITERTLYCILENYQKADGVEVPEVLRPYMGGKEFITFLDSEFS